MCSMRQKEDPYLDIFPGCVFKFVFVLRDGNALTGIHGDQHCRPPEVASPSSLLLLLPITVEGEGGVRQQCGRLVTRPIQLDGLAVGARSARIVHGHLDYRVRHRRLGHAPNGIDLAFRRCRRVHIRGRTEQRARGELGWAGPVTSRWAVTEIWWAWAWVILWWARHYGRHTWWWRK